MRSSPKSRPECAYGPLIRISSLAASNPSPCAHAAWSTSVWLNSSKSPVALGRSDAYGRNESRAFSPSSCQVGTPAALPQMSHRAMSNAPRACTTAPRRPVMAVPTYSSSHTLTGSSGSIPRIVWPNPRSMVCMPGASMHSRATQAFRSVSPIPVMPSSVCTSTTMSSWLELVASRSYPGSSRMWQSMAVIFMRCASGEAPAAGR